MLGEQHQRTIARVLQEQDIPKAEGLALLSSVYLPAAQSQAVSLLGDVLVMEADEILALGASVLGGVGTSLLLTEPCAGEETVRSKETSDAQGLPGSPAPVL